MNLVNWLACQFTPVKTSKPRTNEDYYEPPFGTIAKRDRKQKNGSDVGKVYSGGPGSGCQGPNCGRPATGVNRLSHQVEHYLFNKSNVGDVHVWLLSQGFTKKLKSAPVAQALVKTQPFSRTSSYHRALTGDPDTVTEYEHPLGFKAHIAERHSGMHDLMVSGPKEIHEAAKSVSVMTKKPHDFYGKASKRG